jgi:hypothetical protein
MPTGRGRRRRSQDRDKSLVGGANGTEPRREHCPGAGLTNHQFATLNAKPHSRAPTKSPRPLTALAIILHDTTTASQCVNVGREQPRHQGRLGRLDPERDPAPGPSLLN